MAQEGGAASGKARGQKEQQSWALPEAAVPGVGVGQQQEMNEVRVTAGCRVLQARTLALTLNEMGAVKGFRVGD